MGRALSALERRFRQPTRAGEARRLGGDLGGGSPQCTEVVVVVVVVVVVAANYGEPQSSLVHR